MYKLNKAKGKDMKYTTLESKLNGAKTTRNLESSSWTEVSKGVYKDPKTGILFDVIQEGTTTEQAYMYRMFNKENKVQVNGN